jgi:hypothetical protein
VRTNRPGGPFCHPPIPSDFRPSASTSATALTRTPVLRRRPQRCPACCRRAHSRTEVGVGRSASFVKIHRLFSMRRRRQGPASPRIYQPQPQMAKRRLQLRLGAVVARKCRRPTAACICDSRRRMNRSLLLPVGSLAADPRFSRGAATPLNCLEPELPLFYELSFSTEEGAK